MNADLSPSLARRPTGTEIAAFEADGAVALRGIVDPSWIAVLAAGMERNIADPGPFGRTYTKPGEPGRFFGDYCNWTRIPEYRRFVAASGIGAAAAALMRSRTARFFHEHVLVKEPGTQNPTPWHHDMPYYCVDGRQTLSLWIPLDAVPEDTCVRYVAGSHRWGKLFFPRKFDPAKRYAQDDSAYDAMPDIDAELASDPGAHRVLAWDLAPGDAIAFHFLALHGAPGNASPTRRRRAFAARWLGDDVRYCRRPGEVSPPFPEIKDLAHGAPLPSAIFPQIWPGPDAASGVQS